MTQINKASRKMRHGRLLNKEQLQKAASVMQHFANGGRVFQASLYGTKGRAEFRETEYPSWHWGRIDYRAAFSVKAAANGVLVDASW